MRIENPEIAASLPARLRRRAAQARRQIQGLSPAARWALALLLVVGLLLVLGYWRAPAPPGRFLFAGRRASQEELILIREALDAKDVAYQVADGKVEVAAVDFAAAQAAVSKLDLGPRSFEQARSLAGETSWLDSPADRQERKARQDAAKIEYLIGRLDGVVKAYVELIGMPPQRGPRRAAGMKAVVVLETEPRRELPISTPREIQSLLVEMVPGLKPDAVSIRNLTGRLYLGTDDPALGAALWLRAYEEELGRRIEETLDFIKGVRVIVSLTQPAVPAAAAAPAPAPAAVEEPAPREFWVDVNRPADLESAPVADAAPAPAAEPIAAPTPSGERVRVMVMIPRSYYLENASNREPSMKEIQALVHRAEDSIRNAVQHVVGHDEAAEVTIQTFPDAAPQPISAAVPSLPAAPPVQPWLAAAAAAGAALGALIVLGFRMVGARRPAMRAVGTARDPGRYRVAGPSEPGPSDRVRELIRLDPRAAATVLNRWIGQGEHAR